MEYIIAPFVLEARRIQYNRPEARFRREWETRRDLDRDQGRVRRAQSRLGDVTANPGV